MSLLRDEEFLKLEKDFKFLSRARETFKAEPSELENLTYIVLDIETTGLDPATAEITEIGAFKAIGGKPVDVFSTLINPGIEISKEIENLTGINNQLLAGAPVPSEAFKKFLDFAREGVIVAHQADFDVSFLKFHLQKYLQQELKNEVICTVKTARFLLPQLINHKLPTVAQHLNIPIPHHHRALPDAEVTLHVWEKFVRMLKERGINNLKKVRELILTR